MSIGRMIKLWHLVLTGLLLVLVSGCDKALDERTTLTFVGDSIVARWDLQNNFSSLVTYNRGLSGAGIDYIEGLAGKMAGRNIVVLIGTNDSYNFTDEAVRYKYEDRYLKAINALGAKKVYLYEVMPRHAGTDPVYINEKIALFNSEIDVLLTEYPHITYLRVYESFLADDGDIALEYYNDGLHLSLEGYEILAGVLFDKL